MKNPKALFTMALLGMCVVSMAGVSSAQQPEAVPSETKPHTEDQSIEPVDRQVQEAVLAQDWAAVLDLLKEVDSQTPSSVQRMIKAHACLAENRNNESLCLFASVSSKGSLSNWYMWSEDFSNRHPQQPPALYFLADALSRLNRWDRALEKLNEGLSLSPSHQLILNARGVVYASKGEWDNATVDLTRATKVDSSFADAHASKGALLIHTSEAPEAALRAFDTALNISADFMLALNGRACASLVLGDLDKARADLQRARDLGGSCESPIPAAVNLNIIELMNTQSELVASEVETISGVNPGLSYRRRVEIIENLPKHQIAELKGILDQDLEFNRNYQFWAPDVTEFGSKVGVDLSGDKGALVGGQIEVKGRWDEYKRTMDNYSWQRENRAIFEQVHPDIKAKDVGPIGGFLGSRRDANIWDITHPAPGGVSTEEIGEAGKDKGNWNLVTMYGLLYQAEPQDAAADN